MDFFRDKTKPWCRRKYIVKKEFQARFIMRFLGVVMVASAVSGYLMYMMINKQSEDVFYTSHIKLSSTGEVLLPAIMKVNFGVIVAVLLAVALVTLYITNKVEGPLCRIGRSAEKIGEGDFTASFRLRKDDELKDIAKTFEEMNDSLKGRFDELKSQADEIDRAAQGLLLQHACSNLKDYQRDETTERERLIDLTDRADRFGRVLAGFELEKRRG